MRFVFALKLLFMDARDTSGKISYFRSSTKKVRKKFSVPLGTLLAVGPISYPAVPKLLWFDFSICYPGMLGISYTMEYESFTFKWGFREFQSSKLRDKKVFCKYRWVRYWKKSLVPLGTHGKNENLRFFFFFLFSFAITK